MQTIALANVSNQNFTTTLDSNRYEIAIYQVGSTMACDIAVNEVSVVTGSRITPGEFLIPFAAYQGVNGNFILVTQNDALPDYTLFGTSQIMTYMSAAEIAAAVGGTVP